MKNIVSIAACMFMLFSMSAFSQNEERKDGAKMKELRKAFLTEELSLTKEEGEKFWPLFESHKEKKGEIRKSLKEMKKTMDANESISEKEMIDFSSKARDLKIKEINLGHEFLKELLPILGTDRTRNLKKLEHKFKGKTKGKLDGQSGKGPSHERRGNGPPPRN